VAVLGFLVPLAILGLITWAIVGVTRRGGEPFTLATATALYARVLLIGGILMSLTGVGIIQVFGLPNMRTVLHCLPPRDWTEPGFMGLGMIYTAMPVTNAVPAVVAAAPGIVTLADLPPITGRAAV